MIKKITLSTLGVNVEALGVTVDKLSGTVKTLSTTVGIISTDLKRLDAKVQMLNATVEQLAITTMRGFEEMRATQVKHTDEIRELSLRVARLEEDVAIVRKDMEGGFTEIKKELKAIRADMQAIDYGPEVHVLGSRVARIEKKIGLN